MRLGCCPHAVPERHVAEEVLPFMKRVSYTLPDIYGQVCKRLGWTTARLPQNEDEAQAFVAALRGEPSTHAGYVPLYV